MSKMFHSLIKFATENLMLTALLSCVTVSILVNSYFFGAWLSPDSSYYLRAAREILAGNGFYVYPFEPRWFATWPIGYPALIALVSFMTRADFYLASKILTIIIVWLLGLTLQKRFGRSAWAYALVMLNVGFLHIFYYTWSEIPFSLGLVLVSFWASDVVTEKEVKPSLYIKLTCGVLLLFLSRYIGAFSLGIIGLLWVYNVFLALRRQDESAWRRVAYLTVSGLVSGLFVSGYLYMNKVMAGQMTGMARVPLAGVVGRNPIDNARELLLNLSQAQLTEMKNVFGVFFSIDGLNLPLPLWFLFGAFVLYSALNNVKDIRQGGRNIITPLTFIAVGLIYWLAIVALRFSTSGIDNFSYRLLFPSSLLLFLGFIGLLAKNERIHSFLSSFGGLSQASGADDRARNTAKVLAAVFLFLFVFFSEALPTAVGSRHAGYLSEKKRQLAVHAAIPDGAMILWGDIRYINYLRHDYVHIQGRVNLENISVENFLAKYDKYREVYVNVPAMIVQLDSESGKNDEIHAYFEQFRDSPERFVRIK